MIMQIPLLYTIGFISSVYIWKQIKRYFQIQNNVIFKTLSVATSVLIMIFNQRFIIANCSSIIECLNINMNLNSILYPIICNTFLFLGPIYNLILDKYLKNQDFVDRLNQNKIKDDKMLIKLIMVPILEEITFRALFYINCQNQSDYLLISSILYSLSHFNKFCSFLQKENKFKKINKEGNKTNDFKTRLITAFLRTLFILMWNLVFGYYAAYVFLKTRSLISAILLHSYWNHLGFPNIQQIFRNNKQNIVKIVTVYFVGILFFYYFITM